MSSITVIGNIRRDCLSSRGNYSHSDQGCLTTIIECSKVILKLEPVCARVGCAVGSELVLSMCFMQCPRRR